MIKVERLFLCTVLLFVVVNNDLCCTCRSCCGRDMTKEKLYGRINEQLQEITTLIKDKDCIKIQTSNDDIKTDYFTMYQDMTKDIFLPDAALELMAYRELLRRCGITDALKTIFSDHNKITLYPSIVPLLGDVKYDSFFLKQFCGYPYHSVIFVDSDSDVTEDGKIKINDDEEVDINTVDVKSFGGVYVNDKLFGGLRCDGTCNDTNNCVSCLLYNLLCSLQLCTQRYNDITYIEENSFVELFLSQACNSDFSSEIKNFVLSVIKKQSPGRFNSRLNIKEIKSHELIKRIRQCIMIEWALTVELLKLLSPIIYGNSCNGTTILYRTIKTDHLEKEYKSRRDLFESTSLFGPAFCEGNTLEELASFSYVKFAKVPIYRCIFNYIISPGKYSMFAALRRQDTEQEVGCITLKLDCEELFNNKNDKKTFDNYFT
ncbi:MAG: hypothetical protein II393_03430, partial [Cytophagales bacterium]|nr:hypothetical protein [Cytophagales bacterium]